MRRAAVLMALSTAVACEPVAEPRALPVVVELESAWTPPADSVVVGAALVARPRVRVRDADGNPVEGARVVFVPVRATSPTTPVTVPSDADGYAELSEPWVLSGQLLGQAIYVVPAIGQTGDPLIFTPAVKAGPPVSMDASLQPNVIPMDGDSATVNLEFRDVYGNPTTMELRIQYSSSNPAVATVDSTARVRYLTPGTAWIHATSGALRDSVRAGVRSWFPLPEIDTLQTTFNSIAMDISATRIVYAHHWGGGALQRFDLVSGTRLTSLPLPGVSYGDVAYSPTDNLIWHVRDSSTVSLLQAIDGSTGNVVRTLVTRAKLLQVKVSSDGSRIFGTYLSGRVDEIDPLTGIIDSALVPGGALNGLALDESQQRLWVTRTDDSALWRIDLAGGMTAVNVRPLQFTAQQVVVDTVRGRLYVGSAIGLVAYNAADGTVAATAPAEVTSAYDIALIAEGKYLLVTGLASGRIWLLDAETLALNWERAATSPRRIRRDPVTGQFLVNSEQGQLIRITLPERP